MQQEIKGFDGIRGLAVGTVLLTHLSIIFGLVKHGFPVALVPMIHGSTGVQAFFVLSGFLITTLLFREQHNTGTISLRGFILRRTLRIFPVYILFLVAATLLHVFGQNVTTWKSLAYAWAYVYNFVPKDAYTPFMGHTWSLAVEEHFYLVWPTAFLLLYTRRQLMMVALAAFVVATPVLRAAATPMDAAYFVERWSFIAGYSIALGCLLAVLVDNERWKPVFHRRSMAWLGLLLFANSLFLPTDPFGMDNLAGSSYLRAFGVALLIAWVHGNQDNVVVRALEVPPLKYLGAISYGVYMYQGLFLSTGPWRDPASSWPPPQWAGLLLLVIVAPLSYHFFEKPFLRLKSRFSVGGV